MLSKKEKSNMIKLGIVLIVLQTIATIMLAASGTLQLNGFMNVLGYFSISIVGIILVIIGYRKKHKHDNDQTGNDDENNEGKN